MKLSFQRHRLNLAHPWKIARTARTSVAEVILLKLEDADGFVGWGEASPISRYGESPETVGRFLLQIEPKALSADRLEESSHYIDRLVLGQSAAKCAVNTALLDLAARRAGKSVNDFLNLGFRENTHTTSFTIGIDQPDVIESKVIAAEEFPILKIKVGSSNDRSNLIALRSVSPHKWIRLDANEAWPTKEEALKKIEALANFGKIEFVEQPLPASSSISDWTWLKERSPLPVFGDESYHSAIDADEAAQCFHGVNVKLSKTSGICAAALALQVAKKQGLKTMLGCMVETSLLISAAAHLAELCDYLDLDGNLLISNDPFCGVSAKCGVLSFANAPIATGIQAAPR